MLSQEMIDHMSKSISVEDWNNRRYVIIDYITQEELTYLDSSGLIVQVLGPDKLD